MTSRMTITRYRVTAESLQQSRFENLIIWQRVDVQFDLFSRRSFRGWFRRDRGGVRDEIGSWTVGLLRRTVKRRGRPQQHRGTNLKPLKAVPAVAQAP